MVDREETTGETAAPSQTQANLFGDEFSLVVTLDVADGSIRFEWSRAGHSKPVASARLSPVDADPDNTAAPILRCVAQAMGKTYRDGCKASGTSARALVKRIRKFLPLPSGALKVGILTDKDLGMAKAGRWLPLHMPAGLDSWDWLGTQVTELAQVARLCSQRGLLASAGGGRTAVYLLCCSLLEVPPEVSHFARAPGRPDLLDLEVTFDTVKARTEFVWKKPGDAKPAAVGRVRCTGSDQLIWDLQTDAGREPATSSPSRRSIAAALERWLNRFPTNEATVAVFWNEVPPGSNRPERLQEPFGPEESPYLFIEASLVSMAEALKQRSSQ